MTLNLAQVNHSVKFARMTLVPNEASLAGLNECYKRLKALGWTSNNEVHPTGRTSLFRLGRATIHHDRANPGTWKVEVAGGSYSVTGDLKEITTEAVRFDLMARCGPTPAAPKFADHTLSVAQQKAAAAVRLGSALKPDYLNKKAPHRSEFRGIGHR